MVICDSDYKFFEKVINYYRRKEEHYSKGKIFFSTDFYFDAANPLYAEMREIFRFDYDDYTKDLWWSVVCKGRDIRDTWDKALYHRACGRRFKKIGFGEYVNEECYEKYSESWKTNAWSGLIEEKIRELIGEENFLKLED